jgi:hypothetical protein
MLQTDNLAHGLKYFDALFIVPVFQCFFITFSILGGAVYFKELDAFTDIQWVVFLLAVGTTLFGVLLLSARKMSTEIGGASEASAEKDTQAADDAVVKKLEEGEASGGGGEASGGDNGARDTGQGMRMVNSMASMVGTKEVFSTVNKIVELPPHPQLHHFAVNKQPVFAGSAGDAGDAGGAAGAAGAAAGDAHGHVTSHVRNTSEAAVNPLQVLTTPTHTSPLTPPPPPLPPPPPPLTPPLTPPPPSPPPVNPMQGLGQKQPKKQPKKHVQHMHSMSCVGGAVGGAVGSSSAPLGPGGLSTLRSHSDGDLSPTGAEGDGGGDGAGGVERASPKTWQKYQIGVDPLYDAHHEKAIRVAGVGTMALGE